MQLSRRSVLAVAVGGLALATGCGGAAATEATGGAPGGARRAPSGPLPPYVRGEAAAAAYRFAAARPDLLRAVPCYCGCGASDGHTSNLDCFVAAFAPDGRPTYVPHGAGCGTCIAIALETKRLAGQGVPPAEIRRTIDATFAGARPGTATPPPPD
jgi:hypothetical protein